MKHYVVLDKKVGETPLSCLEAYRAEHPEVSGVPMAYAGRLDPMASGKLLILQGDECKVQEKYHTLDKEYEFQVLFGASSDTQDVLGIIKRGDQSVFEKEKITNAAARLRGWVELPYPHFSSRTVKGKPLHTWALEGRLNEVTIPVKRSRIFKLELLEVDTKAAQEVYAYATEKIETVPKVTDERKALGKDFRRDAVRTSWKQFLDSGDPNEPFTVARFRCICQSGTYMRSLTEALATNLGTVGLAYSIHRTTIGTYTQAPFGLGFWKRKFR